MENKESYKTAYAAAYARLLEQYQPKEIRLFEDPLVKDFFGKTIYCLLQNSIMRRVLTFMYNSSSIGLMGLQICRTKFIDDILKETLDNGIKQLVILGAGFDTRAFRISGINSIKVYEVDLPFIQDKKKSILKKHLGELPDNIIFTPIDFNIHTLDKVLENNGLDFSEPIVFIWEGVTQYITEEAVKNTLKFISKVSIGSVVLFSYILKEVIDRTSNSVDTDFLTNYLAMSGKKWCFGLNSAEASDFLNQYNLKILKDVGASYYKENYLIPIGRNIPVSEIERIIYAKIV
ncbi:class I SAM-dependent methyltransferase [Candidatus Clostridium stratigraminis]|uniref:S-adenosyl-L-methionine-dependent methyltransferase n=1 Tax=Candidatus Clostridium stratigraminis TaxID=3381661 RepID=A0ABW8T6Q9_9CLOT